MKFSDIVAKRFDLTVEQFTDSLRFCSDQERQEYANKREKFRANQISQHEMDETKKWLLNLIEVRRT